MESIEEVELHNFKELILFKGNIKKAISQIVLVILDSIDEKKMKEDKAYYQKIQKLINILNIQFKEFNTMFFNEYGMYNKNKEIVKNILKTLITLNNVNVNSLPFNFKEIEIFLFKIDENILSINKNRSLYEKGTLESFLNEIAYVYYYFLESFNVVVNTNTFFYHFRSFINIFHQEFTSEEKINKQTKTIIDCDDIGIVGCDYVNSFFESIFLIYVFKIIIKILMLIF